MVEGPNTLFRTRGPAPWPRSAIWATPAAHLMALRASKAVRTLAQTAWMPWAEMSSCPLVLHRRMIACGGRERAVGISAGTGAGRRSHAAQRFATARTAHSCLVGAPSRSHPRGLEAGTDASDASGADVDACSACEGGGEAARVPRTRKRASHGEQGLRGSPLKLHIAPSRVPAPTPPLGTSPGLHAAAVMPTRSPWIARAPMTPLDGGERAAISVPGAAETRFRPPRLLSRPERRRQARASRPHNGC